MKLYTLPACVQCTATKKFLNNKGIEYETIDLSLDDDAADMVRSLGYQQAPVIITDKGEHWSGFRPDKLIEL
jgi:glutaredoxin-like protein NrdH